MNTNSRIYMFLLKRFFSILFFWLIALYAIYFYLLRGVPLFYGNSFTAGFYLIAGVIIIYLLLLRLMNHQAKKINDILNDDCDPQAFADIYREMLRESANIKRRADLSTMKLNVGVGLLASGEYQEALNIFSEISPDVTTKTGKTLARVWHHNLCYNYIELEDLEKSEFHLMETKKILDNSDDKTKKVYALRFRVLQTELSMAKGNYDSAHSVFTEYFESAEDNYTRVYAKFYLGQVYLHSSDTARAKDAFEYVIANGNKLHIAQEAIELLALPEYKI